MRYKRGEERVRRKREGETMLVRGEEGKSQSMGNLALEGRCRASKSEESGYDSDTRRSLEVLSGRRGEEETGEEPHYQVPRKELVVVLIAVLRDEQVHRWLPIIPKPIVINISSFFC